MYLESPYDEMVAAHIGYSLHSQKVIMRNNVRFLPVTIFTYRCVGARERGDVMKAFNLQCVVLQYPPP